MSKLKLGLIGKPLGHSWSPEIHKYLTGADYKLWEIDEDELPGFMKRRDFDGINVTIPYKAMSSNIWMKSMRRRAGWAPLTAS